MSPRDPEIIVKRLVVSAMAAVALVGSAIGLVSCVVGLAHPSAHPILWAGLVGCVLGVLAGLYWAWVAMQPTRRPRTF